MFAVFMKENPLEIVKIVVMKKISMQNYRMNIFHDNPGLVSLRGQVGQLPYLILRYLLYKKSSQEYYIVRSMIISNLKVTILH